MHQLYEIRGTLENEKRVLLEESLDIDELYSVRDWMQNAAIHEKGQTMSALRYGVSPK